MSRLKVHSPRHQTPHLFINGFTDRHHPLLLVHVQNGLSPSDSQSYQGGGRRTEGLARCRCAPTGKDWPHGRERKGGRGTRGTVPKGPVETTSRTQCDRSGRGAESPVNGKERKRKILRGHNGDLRRLGVVQPKINTQITEERMI